MKHCERPSAVALMLYVFLMGVLLLVNVLLVMGRLSGD